MLHGISRIHGCLVKLLVTEPVHLCIFKVNSGLKTVQSCRKGTVKYSHLILASFEKNTYKNGQITSIIIKTNSVDGFWQSFILQSACTPILSQHFFSSLFLVFVLLAYLYTRYFQIFKKSWITSATLIFTAFRYANYWDLSALPLPPLVTEFRTCVCLLSSLLPFTLSFDYSNNKTKKKQ